MPQLSYIAAVMKRGTRRALKCQIIARGGSGTDAQLYPWKTQAASLKGRVQGTVAAALADPPGSRAARPGVARPAPTRVARVPRATPRPRPGRSPRPAASRAVVRRVVTLRQIWYPARRDAHAGTRRAAPWWSRADRPRRQAPADPASGGTDGTPGRPAPARAGEPDRSGLTAAGRSPVCKCATQIYMTQSQIRFHITHVFCNMSITVRVRPWIPPLAG